MGNYEEIIEYSENVRQGFDATNKNIFIEEVNFGTSHSIVNAISTLLSVIYRPLVWESWNVFSFIASIENVTLLLLSIYAVFLILFDIKSLVLLVKEPILLFCVIYSVLFAVGIGLSVSNFGAIVRFKSAFLLFYLIPFLVLIAVTRDNLNQLKTKNN